jgi:spermidine synthase
MATERLKNIQDDKFKLNRIWVIFLISVLGLFLEMLLIRWIGTEIRIFAYLQNTILVVCFLGLGLGCFTCRQPINLRQSLIPLFILLLLMAIPIVRLSLGNISELLSVLDDFLIWNFVITENLWMTILFVALGLILTYCVLILVVDIFVPLGRILGRMMDDHPNTIWAYSVNVAGSLIGTWLFVILSLYYQPPFIWFAVFGVLMVAFIAWSRRDRRLNLALLGGIIILSWFAGRVPDAIEVIWSPYQKLVITELDRIFVEPREYHVLVNNAGYQVIIDLRESHTSSYPEFYAPEMMGLSQYDIPLLLHPNPQSYLIVGAGAGNDAAGGLRHNVKEITAVEIDPAIIEIGRNYHHENPYASPSVKIVNDDARSFFATTAEKFDVISFGLLDSHTTTAMTNARLDHYVYTRESIQKAKSLLADGGIMVMTFEAQKFYVSDRMASVLREAFGEDPIYFRIPNNPYGAGGIMFIAGDLDTVQQQIAQNQRLSTHIKFLQQTFPLTLPATTQIATDDWPYIYLENRKIPLLFFLLAGLMLLILARSLRRWQSIDVLSRWRRTHWHFFFLGSAFLLLEVQNISKASVVLGNTWLVNAVIITGVLTMVLLANWLAYKYPTIRVRYAYLALITTCLILYFIDLAQFAFLPYAMKALIVGGLTCLPMLFSGIIFIRSFAIVESKNEALGANLVGALVGALLQSITFVIGIKALLLVVAGLYILSLLTLPARSAAASEAKEAERFVGELDQEGEAVL